MDIFAYRPFPSLDGPQARESLSDEQEYSVQ
jgi:hypothetical protein